MNRFCKTVISSISNNRSLLSSNRSLLLTYRAELGSYTSKQPHPDVLIWTVHPRVKEQLASEGFVKNFDHITEKQLIRLANNPKAEFYLDTKSNYVNVVQTVNGKLMRITVVSDDFKVISFGILKKKNLDKYAAPGGRYVNLNPNFTPKPY